MAFFDLLGVSMNVVSRGSRSIRGSAVLLTALLAVSGCKKSESEAAKEAAPPAPPAEIALRVTAQAELPDGTTLELVPPAPSEPVNVDAFQVLTLHSNLALPNARVRVFDEASRAMVSDDEVLPPAPGSEFTYRVRFPEPLATGNRYSVVVDGETGDSLLDGAGKAHPDTRIALLINGERQKPPPPAKASKSRRR